MASGDKVSVRLLNSPNSKLDEALKTLVGKLKNMDKFKKTEFARTIVGTFVFIIDYDWATNGSPGTVSERGGYQSILNLDANEGEFSYTRDAPKKGTKVFALQGDEDTFVDFITPNDSWAMQNLDKWDCLSGGEDNESKEDIALLLDNLTYAAYQIDGDKGIKTQAASLGLPESANDFLKFYFAFRSVWNAEATRNTFLRVAKKGEIYDFVIKGDNPDPVRLRLNLGNGSVTFDVKKDSKANLTYATDDATFHTTLHDGRKVSDAAFAAGKITVTPKPANQSEKDWAAELYDHIAAYVTVHGVSS